VVREVDLDANRFEIRGFKGVGEIPCAKSLVLLRQLDSIVRSALASRLRVKGAGSSDRPFSNPKSWIMPS
jgi:hypothetical protein